MALSTQFIKLYPVICVKIRILLSINRELQIMILIMILFFPVLKISRCVCTSVGELLQQNLEVLHHRRGDVVGVNLLHRDRVTLPKHPICRHINRDFHQRIPRTFLFCQASRVTAPWVTLLRKLHCCRNSNKASAVNSSFK